MSARDVDHFQAIRTESAGHEERVIAAGKAHLVTEMDKVLGTLGTLRSDAAARAWNELRDILTGMTHEIEQDREHFAALWSDAYTELEHLAGLKERIVAIRSSKQGDDHGPTH